MKAVFVKIFPRLAALLALFFVLGATQASAGAPAPVFVLNSLDGNVSVIDPASWTEIKRIATGKEPHHLYMTPDEKSIIVANALSDSLTFIDPRTAEVQRTVRGIIDPYQLQFSPDMKWFVTAANRLNHVDIYRWDGAEPTLVKRILTGKTPSHIWIDSKSTTVWVTMQDSDELVAIDLPTQLAASDFSGVINVTGPQARRVKVIPTGAGAHAFRSAGDRKHVFVSNRVANTISKINFQTFEVVESYPAPAGPDCMDVSADGRFIYVASRWAKKLTVIDTQTRSVVRQIPVGKSPHGVWTLDHAPRR